MIQKHERYDARLRNRYQPSTVTDPDSLPLLKSAERILKLTHLEARSMKEKTIDTNHLLLAILKDESNYATRYLVENGITYNKVKQEIADSQPEDRADFPGDEDDEGRGPFSGGPTGGGKGSSMGSSQKSSSDTPVSYTHLRAHET